jgi:hypothetical protein
MTLVPWPPKGLRLPGCGCVDASDSRAAPNQARRGRQDRRRGQGTRVHPAILNRKHRPTVSNPVMSGDLKPGEGLRLLLLATHPRHLLHRGDLAFRRESGSPFRPTSFGCSTYSMTSPGAISCWCRISVK